MGSINFYEIKKLAEERNEKRKNMIKILTFLVLSFLILFTCYIIL